MAPDDGVNAQEWQGFFDGTYHVGIGAAVVAVVGASLVLGLVSDPLWIVVAGIVLLAIGVGILVDTWSHGFNH